MPEARIPLAEATIDVSTAPKINSSKVAIDKAIAPVRNTQKIVVPSAIVDDSHAKAGLLGKGKGYKYPHDYGGYVEQRYLPDELEGSSFYHVGDNGYERKIKAIMASIKKNKPSPS